MNKNMKAVAIEHLLDWRECDECHKCCLESTMLMRTRTEEVTGRVKYTSLWLCAECDALWLAQHPVTIRQGADLDNPRTWAADHIADASKMVVNNTTNVVNLTTVNPLEIEGDKEPKA